MWFIIVPFAGGYVGKGKKGEVYGTTRMVVIEHLLRLAYEKV